MSGVFLASLSATVDVTTLRTPQAPLVRLWNRPAPERPDRDCDTVFVADRDDGQRATHHLVDQGHRRIAFLGVHPDGGHGWAHHWDSAVKVIRRTTTLRFDSMSQ